MKIFFLACISGLFIFFISCNDKPEVKPVINLLGVYPNPAVDLFYVSVQNPNMKIYSLKVFDTHGKVILDKSENQITQEYTVPVSGKPKGSYHVVLLIDNATIVKELIKL